MKLVIRTMVTLLAASLLGIASAQMTAPTRNPDGSINKRVGIGVDQRLGSQIPLNVPLTNASGQQVTLGQYFGKSPVILNLVYYNCKSVCLLETQALEQTLASAAPGKGLELGKNVQVVTLSINPSETAQDAAAKKQEVLGGLQGKDTSAWHFLVGSADSINSIVTSVGFHFTYDAKNNLVNHPAALIVLTPTGKVSKYFFGDTYPSGPLASAAKAASGGTIGKESNYYFFGCLCSDPVTGKYSINVMRSLQVLGTITILVIGSSIGLLTMKSKKSHRHPGGKAL